MSMNPMNADVIVYSTKVCPYCVRAKQLLERKGISYEEIIVESDEMRQEMIKKSGGRRTVPQIFINGRHVGGFDDLHALDLQGQLDAMLADD